MQHLPHKPDVATQIIFLKKQNIVKRYMENRDLYEDEAVKLLEDEEEIKYWRSEDALILEAGENDYGI